MRNSQGETDTQVSTIQVGDNTTCGDPTFIQLPLDWEVTETSLAPTAILNGLVARIDVPYQGALVRADIPVFGIAYGDGFERYTVEYGAGYSPSEWVKILSSDRPQTAWSGRDLDDSFGVTIRGNLANWNTGLTNYVYLPDYPSGHPVDLKGVYSLRLVVEGKNGAVAGDTVVVEVGNVIPNAWGGTVTSPDRSVQLKVPPYAFNHAFRVISIIPQALNRPDLPERYLQIGQIYDVHGSPAVLARPALLGFEIPELDGVEISRILILQLDETHHLWTPLEDGRPAGVSGWIEAVISDIAPAYVLVIDKDAAEFSNMPSASGVDLSPTSTLEPDGRQYLTLETFESDLGGWTFPDLLNTVTAALDSMATPDASRCLRISTPATERGGVVAMRNLPFNVREFPIIQFDYRIPPTVQLDIYARSEDRWYAIGFLDQSNAFKGNRVNITKIGQIEGVINDDRWHTARLDLGEMLRTKTGRTIIDELILANWDVTGFMELETGYNPRANMYIDNFSIERLPSFNLRPATFTIAVDDFEKSGLINSFGLQCQVFSGADGNIIAEYTNDGTADLDHTLSLEYKGSSASCFGGYIIPLPELDVRDFNTLTFSAAGTALTDLKVGLSDANGNERKVTLGQFIIDGV